MRSWCVTLNLPHAHTPLPVCTLKNAAVCTFKTHPVCAGTTPASVTTCGRAGTHGDVLNVHTGVFSVPHHTTRTHHDHNDTHTTHQPPPQQHVETGTDRDRERQDKTREDDTREDEREEGGAIEARDKRREKMEEKMREKIKDETTDKMEKKRQGRR